MEVNTRVVSETILAVQSVHTNSGVDPGDPPIKIPGREYLFVPSKF